MSPWIVGFLLLYAYPMLKTLYYSFTRYDGGKTPPHWVGLFYYRFMFTQDPYFWLSLRNTLWMVVVSVPLSILLGVGSAYVLTKPRRGRAFYRTAFFLPTMVPAVAAAVAFLFLLNAGGPAKGRSSGRFQAVSIGPPGSASPCRSSLPRSASASTIPEWSSSSPVARSSST